MRPSPSISILSVLRSKFAEVLPGSARRALDLTEAAAGRTHRPEQVYGIASAGRPIIAIIAKDGEIA